MLHMQDLTKYLKCESACLHIICQVRLANPYNFIYFLESRAGQQLLRLTMKPSVKFAHYLRTLMFRLSGNFPNELHTTSLASTSNLDYAIN